MKGFHEKSQYLLPVLILSLSSFFCIGAIDEVCRAADDKLLANARLQNSYQNLMRKFNSTCTVGENCNAHIDPIGLYLFHDYREFGSSLMKSACERRRNYKMCVVTTKVRFLIPGVPELDMVDIGTYIVEVKKPVCFPPQCSDDQIHIVDPNPAQCRNGGSGEFGCEVVSYDVKCPSRVTSSGSCKNNLLSPASGFSIQQTLYQGTIFTECAALVNGKPSSYCKVGYDDFTGGIDGDMRGEFPNDPDYKNYERRCKQAGGVVCTADVKGSLTIPKSDMKEVLDEALEENDFSVEFLRYGKIVGRADFQGMPQCFPSSCDLENDIQALYVNHAEKFLEDNNAPMSCEDGSDTCEMDISNIQCKIPTNSPTKFPTISPTLSLFPTLEDYTKAPTDDPTSSPTESPTKDPTISPTALPTKDPTTSPTALPTGDPTVSPTALPTEDPTANPTTEQTLEPTESSTVTASKLTSTASAKSIVTESNNGRISVCVCKLLWPLVLAMAVVML